MNVVAFWCPSEAYLSDPSEHKVKTVAIIVSLLVNYEPLI
jgi:hypothetical protein